MSCCDTKPSNPPAATPPPQPVQACPACPDMEIQVNVPPDAAPVASHNLVLLKCEHPAHRSVTHCRIRAVACATGASTTAVLVNPDGRLRFPNSGDTTRTLSLPADGSWVAFDISGETASGGLNDAVIEAHCQTASGAVKATATVTVVSFDTLTLTMTHPGTYTLTGTNFTATGGNAVTYSASARIRPSGVDCTAPQVTDLRIGLAQNAAAGLRRVSTWGNPTVAWLATAPSGTPVTVPTTIRFQITRPMDCNDSEASVAPLYDQPGKTGTLDPNSLQPPGGCTNSAAATSFDNMKAANVVATKVVPANSDVTGLPAANITYTHVNTSLDTDFTTWMVVFNITTNELCALRQKPWSVHTSTSGGAGQKATSTADVAPSRDPITTPPFSNDVVNLPANQSTTTSGSVTFTKP